MDLRDSLNRYYYDVTVSDLRQISRTGGGELSYNSIMYLDVISYQRAQGECTVSTLANTLHITKSAVTIKVNELERLGMVTKTRSETDRRVIQLDVSPQMTQSLRAYEGPFERAAGGKELHTGTDRGVLFHFEYVYFGIYKGFLK